MSKFKIDPRPHTLRKLSTYPGYFKSQLLNFGHHSPNMPILRTIPPANLYAYAIDHDYFELSYIDHGLRELKVVSVAQSEVHAIEVATRGQSLSRMWFEERKKRMQSSMFGRICKLTEKTNIPRLCLSMMKSSTLAAPSILHGRKYESIAVQAYEQKTGVKTRECGICVCQTSPFLASSPDRVVDEETVLEVKCPYTARDSMISPATVPYLVGNYEHLELDVDYEYYYQVQGQLQCSERNYCTAFLVFTIKDLKIIRVENFEFVTAMTEKSTKFFFH